MRSKILNLPSSSSTAVHRSVVGNPKKCVEVGEVGSKGMGKLSSTENGRSRVVIGGGDGNSRKMGTLEICGQDSGQD